MKRWMLTSVRSVDEASLSAAQGRGEMKENVSYKIEIQMGCDGWMCGGQVLWNTFICLYTCMFNGLQVLASRYFLFWRK